MMSSDTARAGIAKRAKYPQKPPIIRYRDVRPILCAYLSDLARNVNPLAAGETMFAQRADDASEGPLRRDDALHSIDVIRAVQRMSNQLGAFDFRLAPAKQHGLLLGGVEVSVRADLLVYGAARGQQQIGAALLRMTQDDTESETAKDRRREMGIYVATLARLHMDQNIQSNRMVANRLCMSIDIQHGEVFQAPSTVVRRTNDLENACRFIAAIWPSL
jgi:hypothetical protein